MANPYVDSLKCAANLTTTENGRQAFMSTRSNVVDFFYKVASLRKSNHNFGVCRKKNRYYRILKKNNRVFFEESGEFIAAKELFLKAFEEDQLLTVLILFWLRDPRGGAGERQIFRSLYKFGMEKPEIAAILMEVADQIPEYGRWDDLWNCLADPSHDEKLGQILASGLADSRKVALLAKWLPREGTDKLLTIRLAQILGYKDLRTYRKAVVALTGFVVERAMSANEWEKIVYDHVPSVAMTRYANAFKAKDETRFNDYKDRLVSGEAKINSSVVFPYEVVKLLGHDPAIAEAAWKALPDYVPENLNIMAMVDVSGSMSFPVANGVSGMDVAISLGIYCAERQKGSFKNMYLTFSASPKIIDMTKFGDTLQSRIFGVRNTDVGYNTDIDKAMQKLLDLAVFSKCSQEDLPHVLYMISDMQFDDATQKKDMAFVDMWAQKYADAGYKMPHIVFHNLNGSYRNAPALHDTKGVSMISGFSPAIIRHILAGEDVTPMTQMLEVLGSKRYEPVKEKLSTLLACA